MKTALQHRTANIYFFCACAVLSIFMLVASAFFAREVIKGNVDKESHAAANCMSVLRLNGFGPTHANGVIEVSRLAKANLEQMVLQAGVSIANCPGHTLEAFCAGEGCPKPGISFVLRETPASP